MIYNDQPLDRTAFSFGDFGDDDACEFWRSQTPDHAWPHWSFSDRSCMVTIRLPTEFKEFLNLLNSEGVEYLLVGGYAVAFHGHPRATADLDIWIATAAQNAAGVRRALAKFGFSAQAVASAPLEEHGKIIRMGRPPLRIELFTGISGVDFEACYRGRETQLVEGPRYSHFARRPVGQ